MLNPKTGQQRLSFLANLPDAPRFKREVLDRLAEDFSITTVEELYAWARVGVSRPPGENALEASHEILVKTLEPLVPVETLRQFEQVSQWEYSFGAQLDTTLPPVEPEPDLLREVGPPWFGREISLINSHMPPIRNQQRRATSVAFATCAVMEYIFSRDRELRLDLSEQWQYWNCKRCDGEPKIQGTSLRWSFYLAARDGICEEEYWPYNVMDDPSNRDPNPPPSAAVNAVKHKMTRFIDVPTPKDIKVLKGLLGRGEPIAFAIPMFASVEEDVNTRLTGNILVPTDTEAPLPMGHTMVLVGYADDAEFAGGGYFIVRNSWGTRWGSQCPFGAGYGTIPYRFIERYNHCALAMA